MEVEEPAYTDGSRVEINGHAYDIKSAGEKTVVLVDEHGKELAWTRSALDAKLESGDAEVLEPKAEAAPDVATEDLKAGDVFEDSDGNALTVKRVDGDKVVAVGADGKAHTYEDGTFEQMVESGVLKRETTDLNAAQTGSPEGDGVPAFGVGSVIELEGHEYKLLRVDKEDDTVYLENVEGETELWSYSGICIAFNEGDARLIDNKNYVLTDNQGNPVNEDGTLKVEEVKSVDELTDEDFSAPTRNVQLPALPYNVDAAIGANGKPVIIKKNIFEKNWNAHRFPFEESRAILNAALYNTDLVGQTQPNNKPLHWVAIKIDDKSPIVVLEVNENKDNIEIVGWYTLDERNLNRIKRQAEKNGGELVMLSPMDKVESLSTPQTDLSSENKGTEQSSSVQVDVQENAPMPMRVVGKGKNAAQEEDWLATTPKRGHDYVFKESGLDAEEANAFVENKVAEAEKNLEKVKGKAPKMGTNIAAYKEAKADYEARVAEAQKAVDYWHAVKAERDKVLLEERRARKEKDKALYDEAVAQEEQRKAEMAQKAAEQEALGSNAVAPAIKEKWENAPKVDGGADEITLPNGEMVTGHYVLTESGAASASHQATNGFAETEGYPVDVNGETVNDRDYKRDAEAQQVTRGMAADYDSRALQSPVVVSGDGVVLSGNGRTMAGEIAALNGSDAKYNAYLRGHAGKFGFTTEQVEGFEHPRVVFVPDGEMPYTAETFAKFNQREQKSQSRTEMAVKLGKVVDDALFGRVMDVIGRHESLAEFYADDAATASVVKELADAGVIPQTEMAQLFDGGRLSESGQAMVEGVLVGKVFQGSPDAVRQITEVKSMRKAVMAALPEVVACHRLGGGYDLSKELAAAVDLVYKARKAGFKLGQHVSQHARQGNLFQLDDGATVADYNNAAVMMLADVMNDGRVTQLKKVLAFYNTQAADSAQGIGDMFAGGVKSKGEIINEVNELLNDGQEYDRSTPSVADGQGVGGEGGEQGDVAGPSHQGGEGSERGLSEAFDGLAAQLKTAEGEERARVLGEMRDGIARFAEENGYPVPEFLLTREDFLAAVPEKDRAKYVEWLDDGAHMPAYYTKGKVYVYVEGCETFDKDVNETLAHEYIHADNAEFPENVNALTYALEDTHEVTRDELCEILREMSQGEHYDREAERLEAEGKDVNKMLADEVIAHVVARMVRDGEQVLDGITKNPTLQFIIKRAYKARENERQYNIRARENAERHDNASEGDNRGGPNNGANVEGESANGGVGRPVNGSEGGEVSSERGRSAVNEGKEVAAPSGDGAKVGVTDGEKLSATGDAVPSGKGDSPLSEKIATASAEVNTEPTEAQKEAGNYKKGHVQVGTFDITIEQPQGSVRKGTDADGKQWESKMNNTYGYIRGAVGVDGDHIDVFLSNDIDGWNGRKVFVVDQYNPDGSFDEHKVMLGFNDADEAKSDYLANYENGWENGRRIDVTAVNLEDFEKWIASSKRKTKPFAEYVGVKKETVASTPAKEDTTSEIQTFLRERGCTPISQERKNLTDEGVVADEEGKPIVLYHGTLDKSISVSELEAGHKRVDGESATFAGNGVYFTPNKDVAEEYGYGGQIFEVHVKLSKPFYMLGNPDFNESEAVQFSNLLKSKGYDGIINYMNGWSVEHNRIEGGEVVVFNNSSILPIENGQNNQDAYSITPSTYTNKKGKRKTKPFGEYSSVNNGVVPSGEGESVKRNEVLEYENALDHLEDVEQKWGDKIQDYVSEHYPTQATTSAESTSEKGLQERKAMKADPVLKQMYAEAKKEIDAADEMVTQKYSALPEDLRQQKAVGKSAQPPTREESILRDVVIEHMKGSGLDVIGTEDGQRVLDMANDDGAKEHRVYHGSGAEFDHFDHSHMGEGEGAQAYGWGTYVTEVKGIAEGYAKRSNNGIAMGRYEWQLKRAELESNINRAKEQLPFLRGEYKAEVEAQISEWEEQLKDYEPHNYLYTVEIPDDNGKNYLDWNAKVGVRLLNKVNSLLEQQGKRLINPELDKRYKFFDVNDLYHALSIRMAKDDATYNDDKAASEFLSSLGYAGIKYPADNLRGGRKDGAKNYVIFNENDAEITDHVRFFKTKNGEAYGFTVGGKIYYDPRIANAETPVHEYAHLWASALKANNAKEWKNVVDLMKGTKVWEEVKKAYPELETDDEIADEVLATYSGRRGAERLREEMRKAAAEGDGVMGKAEAVSALQRVKRAIDKFWKAVADFLHIHYTSAEEVADRVMKDLLDGVDPRSMMDGGKSLRPETRVNIVETKSEHGFKNYAEAKTWAKEHIARTYSGEETGGKGDIRISNAAVDKYLSQSAVDKSESKDVHLAVLKVLPDVIRESVDAEQHADFKKGKDGVRSAENGINPNVTIHRLYGAVRMDGKVYRVKVTLKEDKTSKEPKVPHSYETTKIELFAGTLGNSDNSLSPNTNNSITAANLLNGVDKSYDGGKFFEDYNKIREQFIGEKGAAAADHADEVNTRLDNLSVAREMEAEKKDAKAIKLATGWERGADGKWRYEMPDAKIKETMDIDGHVVKRFDEDMLWNDGKLADVVDAPELFKAYPQLKETRIVTDAVTGDMPSAGDYNAKTNTITIHADELKYMNGILNHEVQHAIQKIEGFARGGSPAMVRSEIRKQMAEVTKQIRQLRAEGKEAEAKELIKKNRGLYEASVGDDDFGSYKSLAGEVESRNVESRMGMSAEERRASLAAETEDVSREDQIFLTSGDGGETAHSVEMVHEPSKEETVLRDVVVEHMKGSGLDVIGTEDGQRVLDMANDDGAKEHRVYHGSGADFDHFDHSHMGEGEGAQAYGWGTYVTEVKGIGRTYAIQNSENAREHYVYSGDTHGLSEERINEILEVFLDAKPSEGHVVSEYNDALGWYSSKRDEYCQSLAKDASLLNPSEISIVVDKTRNLYTVEIPDDDGGNYLDWDSETGKDLVSRLVSALRADKDLKEAYEGRLSELNKELGKFAPRTSFSDTYVQLAELLGSDKKASQLLSSLGYAGIKYPANYRSGGREDGAKNYVIFNEHDAEITDHVRFFKTKNGEAYGFTVGGKIYYDPRIANAETPVHEYAHLWASALKANNAKEWKNVVDLMKGTKVWEEVKNTYPELETDDEIADEVLATYSGRRGAERLREEMRKAAAEGDGVMGKAEAVSALQRVKRAIDKFWKAVADFLHIHYTSAEEVADRVMKDLLDGVDPRKFMGDKAQKEKMRYQFMGENGAGENVRDAEDYTAFASRYGVSEDMVKDYALGMETGNLHKADFALAEIRRTMRVANRGMKLSEFGKLFRPVQKELAERYGDIEKLRQEYIDAEMRERGVMEAARKRAEEESAERKARADELQLLPAEELDRRYFEAVERGDDAAAREMLDEAASRKGYGDTESEYQGVGAWVAPSNPGYETDEARRNAVGEDSPNLNVEDMAAGYSNQPEDIFVRPDKYSQGLPTSKESGKAIQTAIDDIRNGKKEVKIKVYRAVPTSVKESKLRNGDWVTPSKEYAEMHGNNRLEGKYRIIEDEVPAGELWWDGNDVNEWGFDDGKGYKYKNVENSRKLNDLVTRDDNGEIIAPSKRFDENVEDVRYRTSEELGQEYGSRWIDEQTNEDGRHTTQVKNTLNSYKKFGDWVMRDSGGKKVDVLDASSGLGLGTEWLRKNGIDAEDVEPYPSENRTAPTYRNYDEVGKKYDYIISNAVLNVIPDDWRASVLHNMADKLKVGGKLVINVRSAESIRKQGKEGETRITLDDPSEILVLRPNGSIKAYQKGFTKAELKEWCEKELGKGYSVEIANDKNAGGSYDTAVVVTKNNESGTIGVASEAGRPRRSAQAVPNSGANLSMVQEITNKIEKLSEDISEKGEMGAHEFLFNVAKAFGLEGNNLNKSFYKDLGNSIGIRISDHYANADNITKKNSNDEVYGLVVKLSPQRFKSKSDANYLEYVYYPDKLTGERQREIVEGLNKFLQTGDYMQLPAPDRVNRSGKFDVLIDGRETSPTAKHQAANDLARQMHVEGEVEVVTSTDGLNGRQAKAKGWYDVRTGKVTIVLPNNKNAADVRETVFHEVVAHKGLRNLVGEEHFNTFLDNVYNNAEEGIKQTIDEMAEKKYNGDKRKATEEYMAHLAEDGEFVKPENQGFFAKVRDFLTDLLRKVGIKLGFKLTDNDLRYILWRSWKGLAERDGGTVFEKAEDVKMQHELGQTDEARSAGGENGIMFRDGSEELKDVVEKMKADVERLHEGELDDLRSGARAIGGRLSELNKAMRLQRAYDMSTVASVTELAKTMLKKGLLSDMSDYDVRRLLSVVNNVHGKGDIRPYVQKVVDMMVDNRLRNVSKAFDKLLAMRGKKVDARGVEVQGELDLAGQRMADVVWKGIGMSDDDVKYLYEDAQNRMMSANGAEAAAAATDYAGWQIVVRYNDTIRDSKSEEMRLREDLKRAKEDYDAGRMTREAYIEFRESTNDAIRENRIERAEAYEDLYEQLGGAYGESIKRAADFKAAEKARVLEIQHNANSDMEGRAARSYRKDTAVDKVLNSSPIQLLLAPLGTFDQMLRMFGSKNVKGEGYLWNRYMRGWLTATENEYTGYRDATAELDAKAAEVLGKGKTWADLFALERKLPKATVRVWDNGEMRELELPQGNLLYIYMVDKMADGRMKLRKMGVTEDDVAAIEDFLDPRLKEIGDWMQEVYLVEKRGKYNEVHERMFGAAMASIDNYFPLKILKDARAENVDVGVEKRESEMASTITGSVVKRTRNALALDLLNSDAFSVVLDHLQQMEHWSAFAEWNRDLNTLLSYKHFRNQVKNMRSAYGSGERLWEAFDKVARIAAGTYTPPKAFADKLAVNIAKGVTAAKISLRVFTALKQFTSFPAYLSDSNPVYLLKGVANPYGSWKWCMENLPLFEKRWKSRMAGDPRLLKNEMDWSLWRDNVVQMAARWGMTPNAFVDALTVCIGARAMYETRRRKYIRYGYGLEEAERRAKQDASILYNQTQQSSEGAFLSALQVDRSWYSVMFTVFRNSSMSYTRQLYAALRNTGRRIAGGAEFKGISEAFMAKQMERDGIDPDRASKNAKAEYRKSWINDLVRAGVFGYVLQLAWNCGPYALYMLFGDDEKKGKEMWHDIWTHTAFGSVEGLTGGDVWSAGLQSLWNHYVNGEDFNANSVNKDMPLTSDLLNVVKKVGSDNYGAVNDVLNLLVQAGFGVNPQTLTDAAVAIYDYCGSDVETTKECALLVMRVMNCPQSQMDNIYFDEIDATGEEAKAMSVEEIAERYARYKALRSAPLRALSSDALKAAEKKPRERVMTEAKEQLDGRLMTEETQRYLDEYEATKKKVTETRALADTDPKAFMEQMPALARSGEFRRYRRVGLYKSEVNKLTKKLLRTSDPAERRALFGKMLDARDKMLKQVKEME